MSRQDDFLATQTRKQPCLPDPYSSQRASSSTRTRQPRISRSTSLSTYSYSSQVDLPDFLNDTTLDSDMDQRSASSATLLSQSDCFARPLGSRSPCYAYLLHEPGQMTAQRTQRLRARIASVITSLPATCEDDVDADEDEPDRIDEAPLVAHVSKLRRVSGVRDLRRAFHDGNHEPTHLPSIPSLGPSKASYEFGVLVNPRRQASNLSHRSSLRTLVDLGSALSRSTGDLKTLCGSTLSSVSVASLVTKVHTALSPPHSSHIWLSTDALQPEFPRKHHVDSSSMPRPHRRVSLRQDSGSPQSPSEAIWSCAKISRSTVKLAARRGHLPRRVFSSPMVPLSS